jgi:hypothetical protein
MLNLHGDFYQFWANNWRFSYKPMTAVLFLHKWLYVRSLSQNRQYVFAKLLRQIFLNHNIDPLKWPYQRTKSKYIKQPCSLYEHQGTQSRGLFLKQNCYRTCKVWLNLGRLVECNIFALYANKQA